MATRPNGSRASEKGGVSTRGDFEPLIDEATFYRVQAVLDGRVLVAGPRQRNHPDFPLRGFVRCETCGRPLTGSWSKGRNGHYAYYHCQRQCRAVNVSRVKLEGAFVDELALLQPTSGYMRLRIEPAHSQHQTMEERVRRMVNLRRAAVSLLAVLAALTLTLASVGIYGVAANNASTRTREIGIRMAVGARGSQVLRMIVREQRPLTLIGVAVGIGVGRAGSTLLASFLFGPPTA
jgi:hypothetical protein